MKDRFFHLTMTAATLAILAATLYGLHARQVVVGVRQFFPILGVLAFLLAGAAFYGWRRADKLYNVFLMTFWAALFSNLHLLPMCVAARSDVEMRDGVLAGFDRALGVEVPDILRALEGMPVLRGSLSFCYGTLILLMTLAVILPPLLDRMSAAKEYAIGCVAAAVLGILIFNSFQAVGPWAYYDYPPTAEQANYTRVFGEHKDAGWYAFDAGYRDGLITFPSFHAILAALAAVALWPVRHLRWPAAALGALIVVSTVTTGWHYVGDVLAGLAVVVVSVAVAKAYTRLERKFARANAAGAVAAAREPAIERLGVEAEAGERPEAVLVP